MMLTLVTYKKKEVFDHKKTAPAYIISPFMLQWAGFSLNLRLRIDLYELTMSETV